MAFSNVHSNVYIICVEERSTFYKKKHFPLFLQENTPPFHLLPETYGVLAVDSSNVRCVVEAGYGCWTVTDARMQRCWRCSLDTLVHSKPPLPGYVLSVTSAGWNANTHTHIHLTALCSGLPYLDFTAARDSEWQWHQLGRIPNPNFYRPDALPAAQPTVSTSTEGKKSKQLQKFWIYKNLTR